MTTTTTRQRRKARKKARREQRVAWMVELRMIGAPPHAIDAVRDAGNHAEAMRSYEYFLQYLKPYRRDV